MASISDVRLQIFENQGSALVQVSYKLTASHHDGEHEQAYREVVELVGDDRRRGEDGQNDLIAGSTIWDGEFKFSTSQVAFEHSREKTFPSSILDEDGPFREDEIRARVTLVPLPATALSRESNLVRRGALVLES